MAPTNEHGKIIAAVAKSALAPLGFRRKGTSRVWFADHGYWLDVVAFQPSSFSKGSYCNVGVHWLWGITPAVTFDFGFERVGSFIKFNNTDTFEQGIASMANAAVQVVGRQRSLFSSLHATAAHLADQELSKANRGGWGAFHAGIACGLTQDVATAQRMFDRVSTSDDRDLDWVNARRLKVDRLKAALGTSIEFRDEVQSLLGAQREFFKLSPLILTE